MTLKFNGWQRLWIVFGIIYLIIVTVGMVIDTPSQTKVYENWSLDLIRWSIKNNPKMKNFSVFAIHADYSDLGDKELVRRLKQKYTGEKLQNLEFDIINQ